MNMFGKIGPFRIIGLAFVLVALAANQWTLAALFTIDGVIESPLHKAFVWTFQGICAVLGFVLFRFGPRFRFTKKAVLFSLAALAMGTMLGLVLGEICARIFSAGYVTPEKMADESLQYVPSVFARYVFAQKEIPAHDINEKGYRGRGFDAAKPEGTIRLMFYGGSQVFCIQTDRGEDWPHRVEGLLWEAGFDNVEVINAGIPGYASFDCVGGLFAEGHVFDPDYVLLCTGWNDIKHFRGDEPLLRSMQPYDDSRDYRINYTSGIDRFLCHHSKLYLAVRTWYYDETMRVGFEGKVPAGEYRSEIAEEPADQHRLSVQMFVDCARNIGAVPILIKQPRLVARDNTEEQRRRIKYRYQLLTHEALCEAFERTDQIIDEVAEAKGVSVIDASARMTEADEWFRDHIHLTAEGSEELARITAEHIAGVLGKSE